MRLSPSGAVCRDFLFPPLFTLAASPSNTRGPQPSSLFDVPTLVNFLSEKKSISRVVRSVSCFLLIVLLSHYKISTHTKKRATKRLAKSLLRSFHAKVIPSSQPTHNHIRKVSVKRAPHMPVTQSARPCPRYPRVTTSPRFPGTRPGSRRPADLGRARRRGPRSSPPHSSS